MLYIYSGPIMQVKMQNGTFRVLADGDIVDLTEKEFHDLSASKPGCFKLVEDIEKKEEKREEKPKRKKRKGGK